MLIFSSLCRNLSISARLAPGGTALNCKQFRRFAGHPSCIPASNTFQLAVNEHFTNKLPGFQA
jgi:hypothetical protein